MSTFPLTLAHWPCGLKSKSPKRMAFVYVLHTVMLQPTAGQGLEAWGRAGGVARARCTHVSPSPTGR